MSVHTRHRKFTYINHSHDIFHFLPLAQILTSEDLNDIIMLSFSWQRAFPGHQTSTLDPLNPSRDLPAQTGSPLTLVLWSSNPKQP